MHTHTRTPVFFLYYSYFHLSLFVFVVLGQAAKRGGHATHARVAINRLPCRRRARSFTGHKSTVFYHNERCAFFIIIIVISFRDVCRQWQWRRRRTLL